MKKLSILLSVFFVMILLSACEEQLVQVPEFQLPDSERTILLEELTGVRCPNCPLGAAQVTDLKSKYGSRLIPVAVHGGFLTQPLGEGHSKYDFRFPESIQLETYLEVGPKPGASINRVKHTDELANSNPGTWSEYVDAELEKEHVMDLMVETEYDEATRTIDIVVTAIPLKDFGADENIRLSVMVAQNDIEDGQEDPDRIIEDYIHNHVLRAMLTEALGDPIQGDLNALEGRTFNYSFVLKADEDLDNMEAPWVAEHMEIIAAVHKSDSDAKDVLQAAESKLGK